MRLNVQYVNNKVGDVVAVQIPIKDWKWLEKKIKTFGQKLNLKKDLIKAFEEVKQMQEGKLKKQPLSDFLNEL